MSKRKSAVDRLIEQLSVALAKLPVAEQKRVLQEGARLLDSRRVERAAAEMTDMTEKMWDKVGTPPAERKRRLRAMETEIARIAEEKRGR